MGVSSGGPLLAALLSGSLLQAVAGFLWKRLRRDPQRDAIARKTNEEAADLIVARLYAEIERLDRELIDVRDQIARERRECAEQITTMEGLIRQLQQRQASQGNIDDKPLSGPLHRAFRPDNSNKDADLIEHLKRVPSRKPTKKGDSK